MVGRTLITVTSNWHCPIFHWCGDGIAITTWVDRMSDVANTCFYCNAFNFRERFCKFWWCYLIEALYNNLQQQYFVGMSIFSYVLDLNHIYIFWCQVLNCQKRAKNLTIIVIVRKVDKLLTWNFLQYLWGSKSIHQNFKNNNIPTFFLIFRGLNVEYRWCTFAWKCPYAWLNIWVSFACF